jgi:hypothetical protein
MKTAALGKGLPFKRWYLWKILQDGYFFVFTFYCAPPRGKGRPESWVFPIILN